MHDFQGKNRKERTGDSNQYICPQAGRSSAPFPRHVNRSSHQGGQQQTKSDRSDRQDRQRSDVEQGFFHPTSPREPLASGSGPAPCSALDAKDPAARQNESRGRQSRVASFRT